MRRPSRAGRRLRRLLPPLATVCVCGCASGATATSSCAPPPPPGPPPHATAGAVSLSADAATVARGGSLALTAVVAGPAGVVAPCDAPVTVIVSDAGGAHVFSASPAAAPGEPCGTLTLAAGQQAAFHAVWEVDPTLPTGRYEVAVTVGDQPEVDVAATVSGGVAGAPAC